MTQKLLVLDPEKLKRIDRRIYMKKYKLIALFLVAWIALFSDVQTNYTITDGLAEAWQDAGMQDDFPVADEVINVNTPTSIKEELDDANAEASSVNIIRVEIAPGTYVLDAPLNISSYVILSGNHMFRRDIDRS